MCLEENQMKAVLIDVSNLANRAAYTTGGLCRPDGTPTGVIFGILRDVLELERMYKTQTIAFCFDSRESLRKSVYPEYKAKRQEVRNAESDDKKQIRQDMYTQLNVLPGLLREAGCRNLFRVTGYEADDLVASIVQNDRESEFVICSSDADCFQLLEQGRVSQWLPVAKHELTEAEFTEKYGIPPCQWGSLKAWTGCASDNIQGIHGIGEKKAAQFLTGKFKDVTVFTNRIDVYNRNIQLTKLPYAGCPVVRVKEQENKIDWDVLSRYIDPEFISVTGV